LRGAHGQTLVEKIPTGSGFTASGDRGRVTRAIGQLLENASKFCPTGTRIGIQLTEVSVGTYEILVADQGPGIGAAFLSRVFEPFFQIDGSPTRAQGGTGVGLAVSRGVARGHGGELTLESPCSVEIDGHEFGGSCFRLTLKRNRGDS
jgi:signal transduction histidine kinase